MTARELIQRLENVPGHAEVYVNTDPGHTPADEWGFPDQANVMGLIGLEHDPRKVYSDEAVIFTSNGRLVAPS